MAVLTEYIITSYRPSIRHFRSLYINTMYIINIIFHLIPLFLLIHLYG